MPPTSDREEVISSSDVATVSAADLVADEPKDDPARPRARSIACRRCGEPIAFDPEPGADSIACVSCGATNIIPEEG